MKRRDQANNGYFIFLYALNRYQLYPRAFITIIRTFLTNTSPTTVLVRITYFCFPHHTPKVTVSTGLLAPEWFPFYGSWWRLANFLF
ncbi:hypothetical protein RRG08_024362 [Elysia crispata]|uniref:Uncharacterized protein n=1 Tax=Elysia crispata TaxID=231223 RepID=A0AAE1DJ41_9GAST|nr:hypothetical protein RRG08_024362 [Elysia crispata]